MKKVIDGAMYNTETAKPLGSMSNDSSGFDYCSEHLYRTKAGKYFIFGEGGARSRYAKRYDNNTWGGGEDIYPLTREAAQKWAEEHLSGDEYEAIFGTVEEASDEKEQLNISISPALKSKLWAAAENKGISLAALVEEILQKGI